MRRPGYLAGHLSFGQATSATNQQATQQVTQPEMVISGKLIPQRTRTARATDAVQVASQPVSDTTDSQITGLAIRSGVMHRGESPPSDINVIYQINNWKSYPKLVAAAQSCQDRDNTYCSMLLKARIKPVSAATRTLSGEGAEIISAINSSIMTSHSGIVASQPVKLVDIVQLIEVCTSRATGRSLPGISCKPGIEYEYADITQIISCIPPTLPTPYYTTRPIPRRISREPEVTPDLSKYLIAGCVAISLFLSILALKVP